MRYYDLLIVGLLIVGFVYGFRRGLIAMLFTLLAVVLGLVAGVMVGKAIVGVLPPSYRQAWFWIIFVLLFTGVYFGVKQFSYWLEDVLEFLELEWLDSLLGGIVGLLQFGLIVGLVFVLVGKLPFLPQGWIAQEFPLGIVLARWTQMGIVFFSRL